MSDINQRILIIGLMLIFMLIIVGIAISSGQPNDLKCKGVIAAESGKQMLLTDCQHINVNTFETYTVRVTFED